MRVKLLDIPELSPNKGAMPFVQQLLANPEQLKIGSQKVKGATIIDCGAKTVGSWQAGLLFANICLGGMAQVNLHWADFSGLRWPAVEVITDHPVRACMAAQYAGWFVKKGKYSAMGSGPARAEVCNEVLFTEMGYSDSAETAVLCLESRKLPDEETVEFIVEKVGRKPENVYILVAPTASIVGSVQIAARSVETGLHKMMELGYDLSCIQSGWGICPIPPIGCDDLVSLGRTNDAILYGATVSYILQDDDEKLKALIKDVPSCSSKDYGLPFQELFSRYGNFYDIDPLLFSPAEVWLSNTETGSSFHAGQVRIDLLKKSFNLIDS